MTKHKPKNPREPIPITLPKLFEQFGGPTIAEACGCDPSLPSKWAAGQRPGWKNLDALVAFAKAQGYALTIPVGGAR